MERGERLIGSELITLEEIQLITGEDFESAEMDHRNVRLALGFNSDDLMVSQYCQHHNLDEADIVEFLNAMRSDEKEISFLEYEIEDELELPEDLQDYFFEKAEFVCVIGTLKRA